MRMCLCIFTIVRSLWGKTEQAACCCMIVMEHKPCITTGLSPSAVIHKRDEAIKPSPEIGGYLSRQIIAAIFPVRAASMTTHA